MRSSPYTYQGLSTNQIMRWVLLALLPGFCVQLYFFGWGYFINLVLALTTASVTEAAILKLRHRPIWFYVKDGSAWVSATLLAIALPPFLPWWMTVLATVFAIGVGKQLYGGLGFNPFNPAMLAFALLLVAYPVQMTSLYALPLGVSETASLAEALSIIFEGSGSLSADAFTGATPLDTYKALAGVQLSDQIWQNPIFGEHLALGWEWSATAYALGGILLLYKRIISWHIPLCVLGGLSLGAICFSWDPDLKVPLYLHWFGGATMLGAFFIATDPVSAATTKLGKMLFGFGVGVLIYVIRTWGNYPDAVAFAVLLMNLAAPFIDQFTQPRTFGHAKPERGIIKSESRQ